MNLRLLGRLAGAESRGSRGRMLFVIACLAVGVAAVTAVDAMIGAVDSGIRSQSRQLLAADLKVGARRTLPDELDGLLAEYEGIRLSEIAELATMLSVGEGSGAEDGQDAEGTDSRLVELKAVLGGYPFYGDLVTEPEGLRPGELGAGEVIVGSELTSGLGLEVGSELRLGGETFEVVGILFEEPDRLDFAMTLGPRVFASRAGLERSGLLTFGSRVRHSQLVAVPAGVDEEALATRVQTDLADHAYLSVQTHRRAQPGVRRGLNRVEDYLGLVALLSLLLGGVGVAQVVRTWLAARTPSVAILRCLGLRSAEVGALYLAHVALLALVGSAVGGALGLASPFALPLLAPDLVPDSAGVLWQPGSLLRGLILGLGVALLFALPPLTAIWRVPPAKVLRVEADPLPAPGLVRWGAGLALVLGILGSAWVQSGRLLVALGFTGGVLVLTLLLAAGARGIMALAVRAPRGRSNPYLRHGLAALARPGAGTVGAVVALGLGTLVVVTVALVQQRLGEELNGELPADAPSLFLVDVQPDQWDGVRGVLEDAGARNVDSTPVAMARLISVDGVPVAEMAAASKEAGRSRWVLTREQRLTWGAELPPGNELLEGTLWSAPDAAEVSLEERFARDLGAGIGTLLRFDLQGIEVSLTVTSIRRVDWSTMGINFFLMVEPGVLEDAPHWRLAAARLEGAGEDQLQNEMASAFPNVTLLRVRPLMEKVADALGRLGRAVRVLGGATILVGLAILSGAVAAGSLRRGKEAALLKVLGVTRPGVALMFALEYALIGLLAGLVGGMGATVLSWAFLEHAIELPTAFAWGALPVAALGAALLAMVSGLLASLQAIRVRPMASLRG